jgi:hypothetical protein
MADLDAITELLRRQRKDLDELMESTASRNCEAGELMERIASLRERCEKTQRAFEAQISEVQKR